MHKFSKTPRGDYLMIGPYDEALRVKINDMPPNLRAWSGPPLKAWRIHADGLEQARRIVEDHYLVDDQMGQEMMERIRVLEEQVATLMHAYDELHADLFG